MSRGFILAIVLTGTFLRVIAALYFPEMIYPDEHFQSIEPASRAVMGYGWRSWEWFHGTRSWFVPALYMPLFAFMKILGSSSGEAVVALCKGITACFGGWLLWRFSRLLGILRLSPHAIWAGTSLLAFCPSMIVWSGTTFSDMWAMIALWIAMPYLVVQADSLRRRDWFFSGLALGVTFLCRLQMVFWAVGLGAVILIWGGERRRRLLPFLALGYLCAIFAQGVLDAATWGSFLQSVIKNIQMNVFEGVAAMNGVSPWFFYLSQFVVSPGFVFSVAALIAFFFLLVRNRSNFDFRAKLVIFPALLFVGVHSAIGHKELRFILPALPALFVVIALGLPEMNRRLVAAGVFVLVGLGALTFDRFTHFSRADLSRISYEIEHDGLLKSGSGCLLFVDHYWHWTRGEVAQRGSVPFVETTSGKLMPDDLRKCVYAVLPGWSESTFLAQTAQMTSDSWKLIFKDDQGQLLYRKN